MHILETVLAIGQTYQLSFCSIDYKKTKNKCSTLTSENPCGVCLCMQECITEGGWVHASTSLVVAWVAMYLTSYSDHLTAFHEPLSLLYISLDVTSV